MVPWTQTNKYHFPFKEPGFLGDTRLADFRYKAGNVQNNSQILCISKQVNYQRLQGSGKKKRKDNLKSLPLAKNGII